MVRQRLGMVLKDASMVLAGEKDAADLCFNLSTETAKFVNDETRWLTLSSTLLLHLFHPDSLISAHTLSSTHYFTPA